MKSRVEFLNACFFKYVALRSSGFRGIGPLESRRISHIGDVWVCDLGQKGRAAFVMHGDGNVVEVHGGIYEFWKANGGGYGELGFPVSDEADYLGPDARPGDRVSEFENGIAVWRAATWQTEVRAKSEVPNARLSNESACPCSRPPLEDIVDPDACVMENMERAIAAGYSEDEVRAMFLGV